MKLIIITGAEATGKSYIGRKLSERLGYKYLSKDEIKEKLFNSKTVSTWNYKWYEGKAKAELFKELKTNVDSKINLIIESNFSGSDIDRLKACIPSNIIVNEIYCKTKGFVSFKRFVDRNESKNRHPGHHDRRWYIKIFTQDFLRLFGVNWPYKPTGLTNNVIHIDTTNFSKVKIHEIIDKISIYNNLI